MDINVEPTYITYFEWCVSATHALARGTFDES